MPVFVNGVEITDEQVFREMQHHPATSREEAMLEAARALAIRELLVQEAVARGVAESRESIGEEPNAEDPRIQALLAEVIKIPRPDDVTCRRFYDQNPSLFSQSSVRREFEEVRLAIAEYLQDTSWQTAVRQYISILVGKAAIAGLDLEGADSPLVQ